MVIRRVMKYFFVSSSSDGVWTRVRLDDTCDNNSTADVNAKCRSASSYSGGANLTVTPLASCVAASNSEGVGTLSVADQSASTRGSSRAPPSNGVINGTASYVTLPRRKPYLNLKSVTTGSGSSIVNINGASDLDVVSSCRDSTSLPKICGVNIKRSQSFKEGLDDSKYSLPTRSFPLTRTQSYNDGLAGDHKDFDTKPSLSRAPSIDEILESVRNLRAKKNMVKSTPDLYQNISEPGYHTSSMPRHKSGKSKSSRSNGSSGIIGVRYSSKSVEHVYDRVPEPHYEQIIGDSDPYYENLHKETNYENINNKSQKEVIYDRPRSNKVVENKYDQVHHEMLYENVNKYDLPVYENLHDDEPTYMNVTNTNSSSRSKKSRSGKESSKSRSKSSKNHDDMSDGGRMYDIPRSATHIYDTPKKYSRSVETSEDFSEYATPKNNRSVTPKISVISQAKQEQKKKIDDIFAEVDLDPFEDHNGRHPNIPPPGEYAYCSFF